MFSVICSELENIGLSENSNFLSGLEFNDIFSHLKLLEKYFSEGRVSRNLNLQWNSSIRKLQLYEKVGLKKTYQSSF